MQLLHTNDSCDCCAVMTQMFCSTTSGFCHWSVVVQSPDGEAPSTAEVDLFMSTQRIKVLNADTQVQLQHHGLSLA